MLLLLGRPSLTLGRPAALFFPDLGLLGRPDPLSFIQDIPSSHSLSFSSHLVRLTLTPQTQNYPKSSFSHKIINNYASKIKKRKGSCIWIILTTGKCCSPCSL